MEKLGGKVPDLELTSRVPGLKFSKVFDSTLYSIDFLFRRLVHMSDLARDGLYDIY